MSAIDYMIKLANRIAGKLSLAQVISDDPRAVVADAFFAPGQEHAFQNFILKPTSHFSKILPESIKTVNIGASVDAKNKTANFLVSTSPPAGQLTNSLINALKEDYRAFYGSYPVERFVARLAKNEIRPHDVQQSVPTIITIT